MSRVQKSDEGVVISTTVGMSAPTPRASSRAIRAGLGLTALIVYSGCLLVVPTYVSFKAPIKTDRYGHFFSQHLGDRLTAYWLLSKSDFRARNATMPVEQMTAILAATSARYGVDPCLVHAVALYESNLNPNTITTTGAVGLMALQPDIARQLSVPDPFNPSSNVDGGTRLLQQLSQDFQSNVDLILAGYNAGADAVRLSHGVPPFRETTEYVKHVGHIYQLCQVEPQAFATLNPN